MAKFVRISNGVVCELVFADELPPYTEEITAQFRDVTGNDNVAEGWTFDGTTFAAPIAPVLSKLEQLELLITQGQEALSADPLPADILKQIYDLEVFIQNYYRRNAFGLITDTINEFVIDSARTDVSDSQRTLVDQLKAAMLQVFQ